MLIQRISPKLLSMSNHVIEKRYSSLIDICRQLVAVCDECHLSRFAVSVSLCLEVVVILINFFGLINAVDYRVLNSPTCPSELGGGSIEGGNEDNGSFQYRTLSQGFYDSTDSSSRPSSSLSISSTATCNTQFNNATALPAPSRLKLNIVQEQYFSRYGSHHRCSTVCFLCYITTTFIYCRLHDVVAAAVDAVEASFWESVL